MALPYTVEFSEVLKQNAKLKAELDNKDEFIKKLIISLLEEEDKNEKLCYLLQELRDLDEWCEHKVRELEKRYIHKIDFLYCSACFCLGTSIAVLLFKLANRA
jgi:hypothetical protein